MGKSSISTATAVKLSKLTNEDIIIISFDMAHNPYDLFATPVGFLNFSSYAIDF